LAEVPTEKPTRRHQLKGDLDGSFAVDLAHPFRLIFRPAMNPVPKKEDGGIDLDQVTAIQIDDVTDYH
jgi:proteic killer suppression protein